MLENMYIFFINLKTLKWKIKPIKVHVIGLDNKHQ